MTTMTNSHHSTRPAPRGLRRAARVGMVFVTASALLIPAGAASAATDGPLSDAPVVSQASGRLLGSSLFTTSILDNVVALRGATAINRGEVPSVVTDLPIDFTAFGDLMNFQVGSTTLLGDNGIIRLSAVGQYAVANDDGSASAFAGAISGAPGLIGVGQVTGSDTGAPLASDTAQITFGTPADPAYLKISFGLLAASAQRTADGQVSGDYLIADARFEVGGTILSPVLAHLSGLADVLIGAFRAAGITLNNPISPNGTITVSLQDLLDVAGIPNLNALPPGTNILQWLADAVSLELMNLMLDLADAAVLASAPATLFAAIPLRLAISAFRSGLNLFWPTMGQVLTLPLRLAIEAIAQVNVNYQRHGYDGSFTQTALRLGLGPGGILGSVDIASATVSGG